jgi:hypothetical protein
MDPFKPSNGVALMPGLFHALLPDVAAEEINRGTSEALPGTNDSLARFRAATELPDDPKLPGLVAIREACFADAPPASDGRTIEFGLCGYSKGSRVTLEARIGNRRVAVKAYADEAMPEATLYQALAAAGLGGDSKVRVPSLLFFERELRVLVIGWLEGPTAHELVKDGQGARAGELAAQWFKRADSLSVPLGPPFERQRILSKAGNWVSTLQAADPALGTAATTVAATLERTQPQESAPRLVHGTLYARHIYDLGDGPGVIDWQRFGQGPLEVDAGMFLATIARVGLDHEKLAGEAAQAEKAFLAGTQGLLEERSLGWYRATAFLHLAARRARHPERHRPERWLKRAQTLLREAARHAEAAQYTL